MAGNAGKGCCSRPAINRPPTLPLDSDSTPLLDEDIDKCCSGENDPIGGEGATNRLVASQTSTCCSDSPSPCSLGYPPSPWPAPQPISSSSWIPLFPKVASTQPLLPSDAITKSLPTRCYEAMCYAARRVFRSHGHIHGDKHCRGHHGYGLVCDHDHEHKNDDHHGHDCDHHHDDGLDLDTGNSDLVNIPGRRRVVLSVLGMDCPSCSPRVVRALNSIPSVADCHVDVFAGRATVTYHPNYVQTADMTQRVTASTGFQCLVVEDSLVGESEGAPRRRMVVNLDQPVDEKRLGVDRVTIIREEPGLAEIEYDSSLNPRDVLTAFEPWGATYVPPSQESGIDSAQREVLRLLHLTTISAALCFPVLVFAWAPLPPHPTIYGGLSLGLTTFIQFYIARPIYVSGLRALMIERTIDMDLLVALSTGTAYLFSTVAYVCRILGRPIEHQNESYFETSALLVTLVMLGRLIAAYARRRSTNAVSYLGAMQAGEALLVETTGDTRLIPAGLVHVGDILRVMPGDQVPTDGRVVGGEAYVDESSITGESAPVLKRAGAVLVAGTVLTTNAQSGLDMRVTLAPDANTLSRMAELMRAAQGARLRVQDTADRVASWLAPVVLVLGVITFAGWMGIGIAAANKVNDGAARAAEMREAVVDAIGHAVAVLVVSCPCAIALCVPMVAVIAVAVGTRRGVLFKVRIYGRSLHSIVCIGIDSMT